MKKIIKSHILIFFLLLLQNVDAQEESKILQKANVEYEDFSFIKARYYYMKLVRKGESSSFVYSRIGDTFYFNSQYKEALKWYFLLFDKFTDISQEYYFRYFNCLKSCNRLNESLEFLKRYQDKFSLPIFEQNNEVSAYLSYINSQSGRCTLKFIPSLNSSLSDFGLIFVPNPDLHIQNLKKLAIEKQLRRIEEQDAIRKRKIADGVLKSDIPTNNINYLDKVKELKSFPKLPEYREVIFSSSRDTNVTQKYKHIWNQKPFYKLYSASIDEIGGFTNLKKIHSQFNTKYHVSSAVVTKNGLTMFFTKIVYDERSKDNNRINQLKLFQSDYVDGQWSNIRELPYPINLPGSSSAHPALSPDESELYFVSNRNNTFEDTDLYVVKRNNRGGFTNEVRKLNSSINTFGRESYPFMSKNGILYFSSDGHPGFGGLDVFAAVKDENDNYHVENVGEPINSSFDDFAYSINSEKHNGFFSSNRIGGSGDDDIYSFTEHKPIQFNINVNPTVKGTVKDSISGLTLSDVTIDLYDTSNKKIRSYKTDENGGYFIDLDPGKIFILKYSKASFTESFYEVGPLMVSEKVILDRSLFNELQVVVEGEVVNLKEGDDLTNSLKLQPIYFDYGGYSIRKSSKAELDKVINLLRSRPSLKVFVRSHTDSRGEDEMNLKLSKKRAKSTVDYIVNVGGISSNRVKGDGFGESELINHCSNGFNCSEKDHELNRRSEFILEIIK